MADAKIDVNEAFRTERLAQIDAIFNQRANAIEAAEKMRADFQARVDAGKVRDNGDGTYTVTDPGSYDDGEVWTIQQPRGLDQPLILPQTGLAKLANGKAALYTRVPTWHHEENALIPAGVSDLDEVLRLGGLDFEVIKLPVFYTKPDTKDADGNKVSGGRYKVPGQFVTVRKDTGDALNTVGKIYQPIQNGDAGAFLQDLVANHSVIFESAGVLQGGRRVFIGMRLPEDVILELPDGVEVPITPHIFWRNSHDGWSSASIIVTPWNIVCGNTERFATRDAKATWPTRHTKNALSEARLEEARRNLGLTIKYFDTFKAEEEALARTNLEIAQFEEIMRLAFPIDKNATERVQKNWNERADVIKGMHLAETERYGKTAYAAERVFTDYLDNVAPKRAVGDKLAAARATAVITGADDDVKNRVHAKLLTLTNKTR